MLLTSVIIILREVLEAALLISILLAMTRLMQLSSRWLLPGIILGLMGAVIYGVLLPDISQAFDGVGQEVANAFIQTLVIVTLLAVLTLLIHLHAGEPRQSRPLLIAMGLAISLAILREGSEIFIYLSGFLHAPEGNASLIIGSLIGGGIGFSVGALFYFWLANTGGRLSLVLACILLTLVASGMSLQVVQLFTQADWLPESAPMWDSSALIAEDSLLGQLLYALISYEATPSLRQVQVYTSCLLLMSMLQLFTYLFRKPRSHTS